MEETSTKLIVAAVVCAVAALAAVGFAVQRGVATVEARRALATATRELATARSDIARMRAELERLHKEAVEQKMAVDQLRAEAGHARSFIEAEKATGARLRAELAKAREDSAKKEPPKAPAKVPIRPGLSKDTVGAPAQR